MVLADSWKGGGRASYRWDYHILPTPSTIIDSVHENYLSLLHKEVAKDRKCPREGALGALS